MRAFISSISLHICILALAFFTVSTANSAFVLTNDSNPLGVRSIEVGLLNLSTRNERIAGSPDVTSALDVKKANTLVENKEIQRNNASEEIKSQPLNKDLASIETPKKVVLQSKNTESKIDNVKPKKQEKVTEEIINHSLKNTSQNKTVTPTIDAKSQNTSQVYQEENLKNQEEITNQNSQTNQISHTNQINTSLSSLETNTIYNTDGAQGLGKENIGKAGHTNGNNHFINSSIQGYSGRIIKFTPPKYPERSRRASEEGYIEIEVFTDSKGKIEQISLLTSSGFSSLDNAALKSVKRARFTPLAGRVVIPVVFKIEN